MKTRKLSIDYLLRNYGTKNEIENAKSFLEQNELLELIWKISQIINEKKKNESRYTKRGVSIQIGGLTASVLAKFNEKIRATKNVQEKEKLEIILSCIAIEFIEFCLTQMKSSKEQLALQIMDALLDCSVLYEYKTEDLLRFLKFDQYLSHRKSIHKYSEPVLDPKKGLPRFKWNGAEENITKFIDIMKTHNISNDEEKWRKLLSMNIKEALEIKLNESNHNEVCNFLIAADALALFSPINTNGFYKVLQFHCVKFDEVFLKNLEPRERNRRLRARKDWKDSNASWIKTLKSVK